MKCSCGKKGCKGCRKGYTYGTKMVSPMGYYEGSLYANPEEEQREREIQIGQGFRATAQPATQGPSIGEQLGQMALSTGVSKGSEALVEKSPGAIKDAGSSLKNMFFPEKVTGAAEAMGLNPDTAINPVSAVQKAGGAVSPNLLADQGIKIAGQEATEAVAAKGLEEATKIAGQEATKTAGDLAANAAASGAGGALSSALIPGIGSAVMGLIDDGMISAKEGASAAGSAIGGALGSVVPGIGTAIGSIVGGLAGGLLGGSDTPKAPPPMMGKKPASSEQMAALDPTTDFEEMMKEIPAGFAYGTLAAKGKTTDPIQKLDVNQKATAPQQQQGGIDLEYLAKKGMFGLFPKLITEK